MDKWNKKFQYFDCIFNTIQSSLNYISVANGPKCVMFVSSFTNLGKISSLVLFQTNHMWKDLPNNLRLIDRRSF